MNLVTTQRHDSPVVHDTMYDSAHDLTDSRGNPMTAVMPESSFQATDLQRNARDVLNAARTPEGALIRDKDGTNFLVSLAGRTSRDGYALEGLTNVLRILRLTSLDDAQRDPVLYGELAWVAALPVDAQVEFAWAYASAIQSIASMGVGPVEDLIYDWQQTARIQRDEKLHRSLTEAITSPLHHVEL
jgi:hypothetical protein